MTRNVGVILAGGRSSRMGRDKALVTVAGSRMIDLVAVALQDAALEIIVAGEERAEVPYPSFPDTVGAGPLAGLVSALAARTGCDLFLAAVDQPLLRPETVRALLACDGDAVVPVAEGTPQVTCAVYRPSAAVAAAGAVAAGGSLRTVVDDVNTRFVHEDEWRSWGEDGRSWRSTDAPEDVAFIERMLDR